MKNKYSRAFDAVEPDEQKKQETIDKLIEYKNKQKTEQRKTARRAFKSFMFFAKRRVAVLTASVILIVAICVGIPLGLNSGNADAIIESLTITNNACIDYDASKENKLPLIVKVKYKGAAERDATSGDVTFATTNESVATVNENGLVTVSGVGKVNIVVESKTKTAQGDKIQKTAPLPIINTVSMASVASINTKYILPKMETDAQPFISVKYGGEDVKVAIVDPVTGYATGLTDEKAEFNNEDKMFFYPTIEGIYTIEYSAADNFGNRSMPHEYIVFCGDRTAPLFVGEALQIPSEWGARVFENGVEVSNVIKFPRPQAIDNSGEPVIISFKINDLQDGYSFAVVYLTDINDKEAYAYKSSYYDGDIEFTQDGFEFDITKYISRTDFLPRTEGVFYVSYTAWDAYGNAKTLSFEITFYPEYTKT